MALIQWSPSLSVGIAEIDGQHQKLIVMINDLNGAMRMGKGKEILGKIIDELVVYTRTHFQTEEKYFDRFGYPAAAMHKSAHAAFAAKVSDFKAGFAEGKLGLSIDIMDFLSDWLKKHIQGEDRQYAPFLQANGLK